MALFLTDAFKVKAVADRYGSDFHHKLWGKPLMLGAGGLLLWTAIFVDLHHGFSHDGLH